MKKIILLNLIVCCLFLASCASTSPTVTQAPRGNIAVNGLNLIFVNQPLLPQGFKPSQTDVTQPLQPMPKADKLQEIIVQQLPELLVGEGIPTTAKSVNIAPSVSFEPISKLFPDTVDRHFLMISILRDSRLCYYGGCSDKFRVMLSIRTPVDNKEVWQKILEQPFSLLGDRFIEAKFKDYVTDMNDEVIKVISRKQ